VKTPIKIHLVRHAEAAQRWVEARDPALSALGHTQAKRSAERWTDSPLALRSSPLRRAQETAAPLAQRWLREVAIDTAFREVPGPEDLDARAGYIAHLMQAGWEDVDATVHAWREVLWQALLAVEEDTVIFTHFMVINAAVSLLQTAPRLVVFEPDYCSVTVLERHGDTLALADRGSNRTTRVL
jgi:broad specificity phosphatase PhoE